MPIAISVEHLTKKYRLGTIGSFTLAEDFARWWASIRGQADPLQTISEGHHERLTNKELRALDDVTFDVKEGDVLGIMGRNGAGKSTLLKILSQVTAPTSGRIKLRGRVASLLEVGTGFHPELTGQENIYLNGAILGMTKAEIQRNLDEIVAFSECEAFIDTPVKRYSSGMYVRLAFAVAAHLEPEILIVDEVLAVGDAQFQAKCLGKMQDVSGHGRTILFVSHSTAAVSALCKSAILLRDGKVAAQGDVGAVIDEYQYERGQRGTAGRDISKLPRTGTGKGKFAALDVIPIGPDDAPLNGAVAGCDLLINAEIHCVSAFKAAHVGVEICDATGFRVINVNTSMGGELITLAPGDSAIVRFRLREVLLKSGDYRLSLLLARGGVEIMDYVQFAAHMYFRDQVGASHSESDAGVYKCRFSHDLIVRAGDGAQPVTRSLKL